MKKITVAVVVIFVLGTLVGGGYLLAKKLQTGVNAPEETTEPTSTEASSQTPPITLDAEQPETITIKEFTFNPDRLTIKKGTTVTWINNDSATHKISSDSFNSQNFNKGEKFEFQFNETGTFDYICGIHPSMKGTIIVE